MWTDIKELFSVLSYLDLAALAIIAYEVHARGWPWVKAKLLAIASAFKTDVADIEHRIQSIENVLVQAKIAVPAPDPNIGGHPPVVAPQPPVTPPKV